MRTRRSAFVQARVIALVFIFLSGYLCLRGGLFNSPGVSADGTFQTLPFSQDWSSTGQITTDDNWAGVPGIIGFRGDDLTTVTATDPQTILADGSATPVDVIANQANPNTQATGGVAEFDGIANPTVALQGSGTADAPHIVFHLNTTGLSNITVAYQLRDIDGSADNAVEPVALQFRVGASGNYTNIPAGFVADATTGPSLATLVTNVSVVLPAAANNQPQVFVRIITTNAVGNDEWVGIDNILIFVPSEAKLTSFNASVTDEGTLLSWKTGFEADNLGYNLYRDQNGQRTRVNPQIIAGSALMTGATLRAGRSYAWLDKSYGGSDGEYWLEEVDLNGQREWHGPVRAAHSNGEPDGPGRSREQSLMLSRVGATQSPAPVSAARERAATVSKPTEAGLRAQASATSRSAVKLAVKREGWYRVTQAELIGAGFDQSLDPRFMQLFVDGQEQPIVVTGEADGRFDAADAVEFYGLGIDSMVTDARTYWVTAGDGPGRRIEEVKGRKGKSAPASFSYTVERKDRTVYFSSLNNGEADNFFGPVVAREPVQLALALHAIDRAAQSDAELEVILQGVTQAHHRVRVFFNDSDFGEIGFYDRAQGSAKLRVPVAALREGDNVVRLVAQGGENDVSLVDRVRLTYRRSYRAERDWLRFTAKGKSRVTVDGFTGDQIRVLDVTSPADVFAVKAQVVEQGSGYAVTFVTPKSGERCLIAVSTTGFDGVARITADRPSSLRQADREADLVIISHGDFIDSVAPLKALRESQGLKVEVVDVENVYDEFSYGQKTPQALKDFLSSAASSWRRAPRFALLVGDASLDPRNHFGLGEYDFVPTKIVNTTVLETASDDWLTDFDEDWLANMAMGRLPVRTRQEASVVVAKIISYDQSVQADEVLLVTDANDGYDFESINPQLKALMPGGVRVQEFMRGGSSRLSTKIDLLESLNRGPKIVNYYGHGTVDQWSGDYLSSFDAMGLTNRDHLSLVFTVTCLNGYFHDPAVASLAESLLKADRGGAVAVWASTGMCDAASQGVINLEMFRQLFAGPDSQQVTLGEAALRAKAVTNERDTRQTYVLFGDPTSRLK
ncbi:MAG TPA: C25 family cysteine peptidase [Blastocatellia bacterium]|nr:C25 family cysteine peptidase [Blastocatellia bacterium]